MDATAKSTNIDFSAWRDVIIILSSFRKPDYLIACQLPVRLLRQAVSRTVSVWLLNRAVAV